MRLLELKVPPPIVAVAIAVAMWVISLTDTPSEKSADFRQAIAAAIALLGGCVSFAGLHAFRRARTTVNPHRPERTSSLVATGIYRYTRNPMYVGLLLVLVGWSVYLYSPWAISGPLVFVLYIDRFQIAPEERVLAANFGADYVEYQARVRRWL